MHLVITNSKDPIRKKKSIQFHVKLDSSLSEFYECLFNHNTITLKYGKLHLIDFNGSSRHWGLMRIKPYFGVPELGLHVSNLKISNLKNTDLE